MKMFAGGILLLMGSLYVLARSYEPQFPQLAWLRAFAEAGMVGGLADWFAVTALFRHPLGLPIPHTAVIPRGKERIGKSFAKFIHGNFLTAERICQQTRELQIVTRMAEWMTQPVNSKKLASQTLHAVPITLDVMEKYSTNQVIMDKLLSQLKGIELHEASAKVIDWLLANQRYRDILAPLPAQLASALVANQDGIDQAAKNNAPLKEIPLLGKLSQSLVKKMSGKVSGNIEDALIAASESPEAPLWDIIGEQLEHFRNHLVTDEALKSELSSIRDQWLSDEKSAELAARLWQQLRSSLDADLASKSPESIQQLSDVIKSLGSSIHGNPELAQNIEKVLLSGINDILTKHGDHLETMIRKTINDWDANTLMLKLENQVGSDLQFIRINGTLIGGLVGVLLHAVGLLIW